jgi:anti-anti-sigma factor
MNVQIERAGDDWLNIRVWGRFDHSCAAAFRQACADGAACAGFTVDLGGASYIDSVALGVLLILREHVGNNLRRVIIRGAAGQPLEALNMAQFHRLFTLEASALPCG